jgi:hypothetical protein
MATFSRRYLRPHHRHDEREEAGQFNEAELVAVFRAHPWESEVHRQPS